MGLVEYNFPKIDAQALERLYGKVPAPNSKKFYTRFLEKVFS